MVSAKAQRFVWPPLLTEAPAVTRSNTTARPSNPVQPADAALAPTNSNPATDTTDSTELSSPSASAIPPAPEGGSPSARELLVVTPQMLSEYLKPAVGATSMPATNALTHGDLYAPPRKDFFFAPPAPKPASGSQATYSSP
jgi:hypothetical protein